MTGCYLGRTFEVSDRRIFTPSNLKGTAAAEWATHRLLGARAQSQWLAPALRRFSFDLLLRTQDGVDPRQTLDFFRWAAEQGLHDFFVIGNAPIAPFPLRITSLNDSWDAALQDGTLISCRVSLTLEEYC